jgi:hypothetical protein
MLTEFGGISYQSNSGESGFGYSRAADREAFLKQYRELLNAVLNSPAIAGFCYTQLTDVEKETNGLLTADREPKLDVDAVRAITSRASAAVPSDLISQVHEAHSVTSFASTGLKVKFGTT